MKSDNLILAVDVPTASEALKWVDTLGDRVGYYKIGLQLFTAAGPELVKEIRKRGAKVFLDLKLHDIPNTVAKSIESIGELDVQMTTIHTLGGPTMMEAAVKAAEPFPDMQVLGVTILTSHSESELNDLGFDHSLAGQVMHLARIAYDSGLRGLVCSPLEVVPLRHELPEDLVLVTPGVRPEGSAADDQNRVATPEQALTDGSSHVVIGRPITQAEDPIAVVEGLLD